MKFFGNSHSVNFANLEIEFKADLEKTLNLLGAREGFGRRKDRIEGTETTDLEGIHSVTQILEKLRMETCLQRQELIFLTQMQKKFDFLKEFVEKYFENGILKTHTSHITFPEAKSASEKKTPTESTPSESNERAVDFKSRL